MVESNKAAHKANSRVDYSVGDRVEDIGTEPRGVGTVTKQTLFGGVKVTFDSGEVHRYSSSTQRLCFV